MVGNLGTVLGNFRHLFENLGEIKMHCLGFYYRLVGILGTVFRDIIWKSYKLVWKCGVVHLRKSRYTVWQTKVWNLGTVFGNLGTFFREF